MAYWEEQTKYRLEDRVLMISMMMEKEEISELGKKSFDAYQHESQPIAIYALTQFLDTLKDAEPRCSDNPLLLTKRDIHFAMMLTHARLAKIYVAMGKSELSQMHVTNALRYASMERDYQTITNQAMLDDLLESKDKIAK
jgi:hypothetical protein